MKKLIFGASLLALGLAGNANAAGYQLNEYSITNLGRAFAGAGIMGDDYSALANNPAGMTLVKRSGMSLGLVEVEEYSVIKGEGAYEGQGTKMHYGVPLPSAFGQWNVNDKLFLGAGFYVPFGLSTKHKSGSFIGQAPAITGGGTRVSELEVMDTAIAAAYKVNSKLSLGATLIYRYIHGNMTSNVMGDGGLLPPGKLGEAGYDLDGWTWTGNLGLMYEFTPDTRIGISYRMKSKQTVKGDYTNTAFGMLGQPTVYDDGRASPDLPSSIIISGYHKLNDKLGLSASAKWTNWSVFKRFTMTSPTAASNPNPLVQGMATTMHNYQYRDSWTLSLGADVYLNDRWTWRFGTAYDQSPVRSAAHRSNRIPDVNRTWLTTGLSYEADNWQVDFGYAHLFMNKGRTGIGVDAEYSSHSNMYGLNVQYKF